MYLNIVLGNIIVMNPNIDSLYFINDGLSNPTFNFIMPHFTDMGGFATLLCLLIVAILVCRHFKKEKYLKIAKLCLYALLLSGLIAATLKLSIHQPRPYTVLRGIHQLVTPTEPNSFPSGHTSSSFSVVTVLSYSFRDHKVLVCLLVLFSTFIAFSRIYCGMHYPLDVIVGAIVGMASGAIVLKVKL
jgi:undecaprenyl-diphosphatase